MSLFFALSLHGDFLYWTDWYKKTVMTVHKSTGEGRRVVLTGVQFPADIEVGSYMRSTQG